MLPLEKTLRNKLERTVKDARDVAEDAARAVLTQLGVGEALPFSHLTESERELRRKLRAHGRQLGDRRDPENETQDIDRLVEEVAYEHWHRMLFARFLAENNLLMYPDPNDPVPITLEECEDLAADEGAKNGWELAASFAAQMLPQIFRPDSPVFQLELPPEHQQKLERLLSELPTEVFTASDSLGWVYQFWQAKKKDEVNASEVKIDARELPAVTQLFTEPYMVSFLLDNSLGAWWAARRLTPEELKNAASEEELRQKAALPGVPLEYLRFVKSPSHSSSFPSDRVSHKFPSPLGRGGRGEGNKGKKLPIPRNIFQNARNLRKNQTDAEQLLWNILRGRRFAGKKFRRQHPVGQYIIDFYCHELKLAIELDGGQHNEETTKIYDAKRSNYLEKQGIRIIRFWNNDVLQNIDVVLEAIWQAVHEPSPPTPLPGGEGGMWQPAAGTFDGWPESLRELKILDPCCGSGHFLVAALLMLVPMRMELEGLTAREAVDAVLRDNLHGLEIDRRCVELAAFALALTAWRYPGEDGRAIGYRKLPELNLACSGLSISVSKEEWQKLANGNHNLRIALGWLYDEFQNAPVLGSLLDPAKSAAAKIVNWKDLAEALETVLKKERSDEEKEAGVVAHGLAKAANLLADKYHLVITNVPYLKGGYHDETLKQFCEKEYPRSKYDLATVFFERLHGVLALQGVLALVTQQSWLFSKYYKSLRKEYLNNYLFNFIARLGAGAFECISGEVVNVCLQFTSLIIPENHSIIRGMEIDHVKKLDDKIEFLKTGDIVSLKQFKQLRNPDYRISFNISCSTDEIIKKIADFGKGSVSGDGPHYIRKFWEIEYIICNNAKKWLNSPGHQEMYSGREHIIIWDDEWFNPEKEIGFRFHGQRVFGKLGVAIGKAGNLRYTPYLGEMFYDNVAVISPYNDEAIGAVWCYAVSGRLEDNIRILDKKIAVTAGTFVKVPFDLDYWTKVAQEKYPNGLPKPYSNDPTQWIFHGHPCGSVIWDEEKKWTAHGPLRTDATVLQVAVARLLGYRWPAELDVDMELADEQREWVKRCKDLLPFADGDGIVCIPSVRGEQPADERLLGLLAAAYGDDWNSDILSELLASADHAGKTLETWLRDKFFAQHCKLFHHRPFIWHIWDGLRDGFAALVNYHKLGRKNLETLIYTYLGDWINRQKRDIEKSVDGAEEKLGAAISLKKKLELILKGESPHDIFVRWKPIDKQPIGWEPDLNDGVRLNIRPFMTVGDVKKKGAGILRDKPNIHWKKDRGKDVESAPWYRLGTQYGGKEGDRINDHHLTLEKKRKARKEAVHE